MRLCPCLLGFKWKRNGKIMKKKSVLDGSPTSLIGVLLFSLLILNHFLRHTSPRLTGVRGTNPLPFNHFFLYLSVKIVFSFSIFIAYWACPPVCAACCTFCGHHQWVTVFYPQLFKIYTLYFAGTLGISIWREGSAGGICAPACWGWSGEIEEIMERKKEWLAGRESSFTLGLI